LISIGDDVTDHTTMPPQSATLKIPPPPPPFPPPSATASSPASAPPSRNSKDCAEIAQVCCGGICLITTVSCVLAYIIIGLIVLVEDSDVWRNCDNDSELWPYCLVAILLYTIGSTVVSKNATSDSMNNNPKGEIIALVCGILIELGLAIWGAIELFNKSESTCCTTHNSKNLINGTCRELTATRLWTFGLVTNIISWIIIVMCLVIFIVLVICMVCDRRKTVAASVAARPPTPYAHTSCTAMSTDV